MRTHVRRRPAFLVASVLLIGVAVAGVWVVIRAPSPTTASTGTASTTTTPIVRTTLAATEPVTARVTPTGQWTITATGGAKPGEVRSAETEASAAAAQLADARAALAAAQRVRDLTLAANRTARAAAASAASRGAARRQLALDAAVQGLAVSEAESAATQAATGETNARASLEAARARACACGSTLTAVATLGSAVDRGGALYALDGQPTVLLIGETPVYRAMRLGDRGADVAQLQRNLAALGYETGADGNFDAATQAAVKAWQTARGVSATGVVRLGDVVFLPSAVLVAGQHVGVGGGIAPGQPVLDLSSNDLIVNATLDPGAATHVHTGDVLAIRLLDGSQTSGRVIRVGSVATAGGSAAGGSAAGGAAGSQGGETGTAFGVAIQARADDPSRLAGLAGASVSIEITLATVTDVLAAPVDALVILADGRPAVEVATGSTNRFVPVQTGVYDRSLVEISGDGLSAGDLVVVPAS